MEVNSSTSHIFHHVSILFAALILFRIVYILIVPLDLSPDEAYYWDWSRRLDWGYYSKPPMVAWIDWLSTALFGVKTWAVRIPAALLSTGSIFFIYLLGKEMFDKKAGLMAALAIILAPGASIPALIMTIDPPLLFFWSATLYALWKAVISQKPLWWIAAGISCGLGLLSKQTMAALIPFTFIFFIIAKEARHHLKTVWPYITAFIAMLLISPFLFWNYKHGWITFAHTSHHFEEVGRSNLLRPEAFFAFLGSQLLVFSPLTFLLFMAAPFAFSKEKRDIRYIYLLYTGVIPLICIAILSFKQTINANWPAPFYASSAILLGAAASSPFKTIKMNKAGIFVKRWFKTGMMVGCLFTFLVLILPFIIPSTPLGGSKLDPTKRLRGWKELGRKIDSTMAALPNNKKTFLIAKRRQTVSEMAFYCKGNPIVYQWPDARGRIRSQYHLWPGAEDHKGWDALFVIQSNRQFPENAINHFKHIIPLSPVEIILGPGGSRSFNVYLGKFLKSWP